AHVLLPRPGRERVDDCRRAVRPEAASNRTERHERGPQVPFACYCPVLKAGYALWITIEPPAIASGRAVSISVLATPIRLSKLTLPPLVLVIRIRNLSTPPPLGASPS